MEWNTEKVKKGMKLELFQRKDKRVMENMCVVLNRKALGFDWSVF